MIANLRPIVPFRVFRRAVKKVIYYQQVKRLAKDSNRKPTDLQPTGKIRVLELVSIPTQNG
tara:strand:- start:370 stop:552 length:183 start_codon:yes stop_codon:yes gene_type:complete